ncbi:Copper-transporting ATPase PAA1, chloroplastic [Zea mays]|uniref:Copper-transporting ATPase PAA1, chloroplastic n=1 Tax=Zea mays TaxID=4577 RepID=A0A3L6DE27_MAIZE|nr:Copper-transporting ATPase PAA1, chloroplastic [Zea mays]
MEARMPSRARWKWNGRDRCVTGKGEGEGETGEYLADELGGAASGAPEVAAATVDVEKATAIVWTTPEAKATKDWQKQLAEKLANHLTSCGFQSHLQDEGEAEQTDA